MELALDDVAGERPERGGLVLVLRRPRARATRTATTPSSYSRARPAPSRSRSRSGTCRRSTRPSTDASRSSRSWRAVPACRRGAPRCSCGTSSSRSPTRCRLSTETGSCGRRTWRRATSPIRCCCGSARPSPASPGSCRCWRCWTPPPCTSPSAPSSAPSEARMCLRMGFTALRRIAQSLHWQFDLDPLPDGPDPAHLRGVRLRGPARGRDRLSDRAGHRGGLAEFPRLAGELRGTGLPHGRPGHRAPSSLVRPAAPPSPRAHASEAATRTATRRAGCSSTRNNGPIPAPVPPAPDPARPVPWHRRYRAADSNPGEPDL